MATRARMRLAGIEPAEGSCQAVVPRAVRERTTRTRPRVGTAAGRAGIRPGHLEGAPTVYVRSTQDASAGARTARSEGEGERRRGRAGDRTREALRGFRAQGSKQGK